MEFVQALAERLEHSAHVKTVYGEPIVAEGRTVVPVAQVGYGFGGGSGKEQEGKEGGGGGGGVAARPVGVVEISGEGTRWIPFTDKRKLAAMWALGLAIGWWLAMRRSR